MLAAAAKQFAARCSMAASPEYYPHRLQANNNAVKRIGGNIKRSHALHGTAAVCKMN
jgi:hypothetical protein